MLLNYSMQMQEKFAQECKHVAGASFATPLRTSKAIATTVLSAAVVPVLTLTQPPQQGVHSPSSTIPLVSRSTLCFNCKRNVSSIHCSRGSSKTVYFSL